jgi:predicted nucleotide-binding protein
LSGVDYNQSGDPRAINGSASSSQPSPQITIQVQAMDSRSFIDHSQDIAKAVREAMLNMHSLNDVISDL